jgi:hypothetical protein
VQCPECGATASEDDLFCGECATILIAGPAAERPVAPGQRERAEATQAMLTRRANAAFILGVIAVALVAVYCVPVVNMITCVQPLVGIAGIVLGALTLRDIPSQGGPARDQKRARQGLILSIVGITLYLAVIVLSILLGAGLDTLGGLD